MTYIWETYIIRLYMYLPILCVYVYTDVSVSMNNPQKQIH